MKQLAIVIPAYKLQFLEKTLESISRQTCKLFTVYIGDDCSPYNLKSIFESFSDRIDIHYKRFEENLGGKNLVQQWERCIELTNNEPWIWLFSDDDIMDINCVENFYKTIRYDQTPRLLHYNIKIIDGDNKIIKEPRYFENLSGYNFAIAKLRGQISSYAVEYIFHRDLYDLYGGFQKFDLAWNSDDATWIKYSQDNGIETIENAYVLWRQSDINISPNNKDKRLVDRKLFADIEYAKYLCSIRLNGSTLKIKLFLITWFTVSIIKAGDIYNSKQRINWLSQFCDSIKSRYLFPVSVFYYLIKK